MSLPERPTRGALQLYNSQLVYIVRRYSLCGSEQVDER